MTQTPMQKAVEAGAKAHHEAHCSNPDLLIPWEAQWDGVQHMLKEYMHKALTAALASLEADGWELARFNKGACIPIDRGYTAMFNAAPEVK